MMADKYICSTRVLRQVVLKLLIVSIRLVHNVAVLSVVKSKGFRQFYNYNTNIKSHRRTTKAKHILEIYD